MSRAEGIQHIQQLRRKWVALKMIQFICIAAALALIVGAVGMYFTQLSILLILLLFFLILSVFLLVNQVWKISLSDIAAGLNSQYPDLEESAGFFLRRQEEISSLQSLQMERIGHVLLQIDIIKRYQKSLWFSFSALATGIIIFLLVFNLPPLRLTESLNQPKLEQPKVKEIIPVAISDFSVTIKSPAYTNLSVITQNQFSISAATGAQIKWVIETSVAMKTVKMILNAKEIVQFSPVDESRRNWIYSKIVNQSGFYQLELNGKKSEFYQLNVVPDLPVIIKINHPKQHTTIDIGQPQQLNLNISLTDDYGISSAFLSATMASGKGEGVSFTEKKIALNAKFANQRNIKFQQLLDLKKLGMKPGDELYFFINATDNHGQSSRSDIYFASIVDTAELMSMSGMANGVNLVPEYFRSQRQIIIDTEKLLKEQNELTVAIFKTRSNELGVDQKLLRLRYGQFLGEESETEIGGDHDDDHDEHKEEVKFGDTRAIMDKYAHKHDVAEDPTFFEPEVKAKLKAVLTEMWNAELKLRTYQPQIALPFEYKALRLLKDLQQQTRAYVAKTTIKTASLKPEKRLSGELDKILQPVQQMSIAQKERRNEVLKTTLSILENSKTGKKLTDQNKLLLGETEKYMISSAADQPSTFLSALTSVRKLSVDTKTTLKDIENIQKAIGKMIKDEFAKPELKYSKPSSALYKSYFRNLTKAGNSDGI